MEHLFSINCIENTKIKKKRPFFKKKPCKSDSSFKSSVELSQRTLSIGDSISVLRLVSSGQSYKHFMLVIYDPRVVIWGIFKSGTTLVS